MRHSPQSTERSVLRVLLYLALILSGVSFTLGLGGPLVSAGGSLESLVYRILGWLGLILCVGFLAVTTRENAQ